MTVARVAGIGALALAVILAVYLLIFKSPGGHEYTLVFQSAGQLVKDDDVQIGGMRIDDVDQLCRRHVEITHDVQ